MIENSLSRRRFLRAATLGGAALATSPMLRPLPLLAQPKILKKVNIIGSNVGLPQIYNKMVVDLGYMAEFGLEPDFLDVADASKMMGGLLSGTADICALSGFSQVSIAAEKGGKIKVIAGSTLLLNQCVFSRNPAIKTVKDLTGKTIGVGPLGSLLHQLMIALLTKKGVDVNSVTFRNVGNNQEVFRAIVAGAVDAGPSTIDVYNKQDKYGVHSLTDGEFWTQLPEYTQQGAYATEDAIANKRDLLVGTLAAYGKLYRFLQSPDSEAAFIKARAAALGSNADEVDSKFQWEWIQKYKPLNTAIVLSEERMNYMQRLNVELGVQKSVLPFDKVADMSLAQEAAKLIA